MTLTAGGFTTYAAIGNREDLTDEIYMISPSETPFVSAIGRTKAKVTLHEWQEDKLAPPGDNAQLEGGDVTPEASIPTVRRQNVCQILRKAWAVTGTQEAVDKAGRASEVAWQVAKRGKELKTDIEYAALANQGMVAGGPSTARRMRGLESWLTTNVDRGDDGEDAADAESPAVDGDERAFTEDLLKSVVARCYGAGGEPSMVMVGPINKQVLSGFSGRSSARQTVDKPMILAAASIYVSDFGDLKVVPNRIQRERTAFVVQPDMAAMAYLRPIRREDLARSGDSLRGFVVAECTLEVRNEAAHGAVADLATVLA